MTSEIKNQSEKVNQLNTAKQLASHPNSSAETLEKLSEEQPVEVLERVAENANTSSEVLTKLAAHSSSEVRSAVGENAHTSRETVQQLAGDEHADVRYQVAGNANAPSEVLDKLTEDENPYVVARAHDTIKDQKSVRERADELLVQEQFAQAEPLYRQLITDLEHLIGPNHLEVAEALHKLAASLIGQGNETGAMEVAERAKRIKDAISDVC